MLNRILSAVRRAIWRPTPGSFTPDELAASHETQAILDRFLRRYLEIRFGKDPTRIARILEAYNDWLTTAVMRLHIVSADGTGVLVPIRLLDALARELGYAAVSSEIPPWAIDEEGDWEREAALLRRIRSQGIEASVGAMGHEGKLLRELAERHGLNVGGVGAT
jgi:hypothetical protein